MGTHSMKVTLGLLCHLSKGIQSFIIQAFSGLQKTRTKHFHVQKTLKVLNLWKSLNYQLSLTWFQQQQQNQVLFYFILLLPHLYSGVLFSSIAHAWAGYNVFLVGILAKLIIWRNHCRINNSCTNGRNWCLYYFINCLVLRLSVILKTSDMHKGIF